MTRLSPDVVIWDVEYGAQETKLKARRSVLTTDNGKEITVLFTVFLKPITCTHSF